MISDEMIHSILCLQKDAIAAGNPPFAAIIISDNQIVAAAHNTSRSTGNPLEHAEMAAIQSAIRERGAKILSGAHLISSNEPCPMCIGACIWSGIREVSYFVSQEEVEAIRGWGRFMPARDIVEADDSGIVIYGPIANEDMRKLHEEFWMTGGHSALKHTIHLTD